jgi:carbamoyl-phosphate synthase large subunit
LRHRVYCTTTIASARAVCEAMAFSGAISVNSLQDLHKQAKEMNEMKDA